MIDTNSRSWTNPHTLIIHFEKENFKERIESCFDGLTAAAPHIIEAYYIYPMKIKFGVEDAAEKLISYFNH